MSLVLSQERDREREEEGDLMTESGVLRVVSAAGRLTGGDWAGLV